MDCFALKCCFIPITMCVWLWYCYVFLSVSVWKSSRSEAREPTVRWPK